VGPLNSKPDTKVSFSTDLISDISKSHDDARLVFRHVDPKIASKQRKKLMLTEAASELLARPDLSERILSLEDPASEELFGKSIACIEEVLGYSRVDPSNFKTFGRSTSSKLVTMNAGPHAPHEDTSGQCLQRDFIHHERTGSMEAGLITTYPTLLCRSSQPCTMTNRNTQQSFNASRRPSITSAAPVLFPNLTAKFHTLSSHRRQALPPLEKERRTVSRIPTITSTTIQKTLRSLSPLGPVNQPPSRIPSSPGPADLPICVLCALDRGYWPEFAQIPGASLKGSSIQ
ncbi:Superfamily II DNA/RNA helicase, SNF2 family protein, partial [Giardia duodenalis]